MKRTIGILVIGLALMFTSVYAGNPQKKNFVAKYPQCQAKLEQFQAIDKEIRALPPGQVSSDQIQQKVAAWKDYKACEKEVKQQTKQEKNFNEMAPASQTELQQQLKTVKPQ